MLLLGFNLIFGLLEGKPFYLPDSISIDIHSTHAYIKFVWCFQGSKPINFDFFFLFLVSIWFSVEKSNFDFKRN